MMLFFFSLQKYIFLKIKRFVIIVVLNFIISPVCYFANNYTDIHITSVLGIDILNRC